MAAPSDLGSEPRSLEYIHSGISREYEHSSNVSSQLLYPETYGDSYREAKLKILGKGSDVLMKAPQKTSAVPPSTVLSRIKSFLPQLATANKDMAEELATNPDSARRFNIEHIEDTEELQVEMNVSLIPPELLGDGDNSSLSGDSESEEEFHSQDNGHLSAGDALQTLSAGNTQETLSARDTQQTLKLRTTSSKLMKPCIEVISDVKPKKSTEETNVNR